MNDLDLSKEHWKESAEGLWTDSLWLIPARDNSGAHSAGYHGNFVPQIPHQLLRRFTKPGDWVLDPFLGSGTTLIEAQRLDRNGIGIELQQEVAQAALARIPIGETPNMQIVVAGDSRTYDVGPLLAEHGVDALDLVIMHPPYADIIQFSEDPADLSNAGSTEAFLCQFQQVVQQQGHYLRPGGHLALVVGDKYAQSEWHPLGFDCMQVVRDLGYRLKSIVVKDMQNSRAKQGKEGIWRYRALKGGFYVFRHEYLFLFQAPQ